MKKFVWILLLTGIGLQGHSQMRRPDIFWLSLSGGFEYGTSNIIDDNIRKDENMTYSQFNPTNSKFVRLGITFYEQFSISASAALGEYTQLYDIESSTVFFSYSKELQLQSQEFTVVGRYTNFYGLYLEAGPKVSLLDKVSATYLGNVPETLEQDQSGRFLDMTTHLMVGAGMALFRSPQDRFRVNFGLRGYYNLGDIMTQTMDTPVRDMGGYDPIYDEALATTQFALRLRFEITYFFAYMGQSTCGRSKIKFFQ